MIAHFIATLIVVAVITIALVAFLYNAGEDIPEPHCFWCRLLNGAKNTLVVVGIIIAFLAVIGIILWAFHTVFA